MKGKYGFKWEPGNEAEVCILFGLLMPLCHEELEKLGYPCSELYIDEFPGTYPDCTLLVDGRELRVEFELYSSNFVEHDHDPEKCDLVVCWKQDRSLGTLKILELYKVVRNFPGIIENPRPKLGTRIWSVEEFKDFISKNLPPKDSQEILNFLEELKTDENIELWEAKGKLPVITISFRKQDFHSLWIEARDNGIAVGITYYNVNVKPPEPYLPKNKIEGIRKVLNEPEKLWHYISASNTKELVDKLRKMIEIIESETLTGSRIL
jgi:hypothetical protein